MKKLLVLTFLLTSSLFLFSQASIPSNIVGTWEGEVVEKGRSDSYHVSITITSAETGDRAGEIWYRDYDCGGYLTFTGVNDGDIFILGESLTSGDGCIDNGLVSVKYYEGTLFFIWTHPDYDHLAEGILQKK